MPGSCAKALTNFQTFSAFSIHSRVRDFIKYDTLFSDLVQEEIAHFQPPLQFPRLTDHNINWEFWLCCHPYFSCLFWITAFKRYNHQNIHIRIFCRLAIGIRTEENNLLGFKLPANLAGKRGYSSLVYLIHITSIIPIYRSDSIFLFRPFFSFHSQLLDHIQTGGFVSQAFIQILRHLVVCKDMQPD